VNRRGKQIVIAMNSFDIRTFPFIFPLYFALLWFGVTSLLGYLSGWYSLMRRYPNNAEPATLTLKNQSGALGFVNMRSILNLSVCPSGLRISMMRVFGPFCRDFFVPWAMISVSRRDRFLWRTAVLTFAPDGDGRLSLPAEVADRLARAASPHWPEPGPFPEETNADAGSRIFKQWVATTGIAAAFFLIVPRVVAPAGAAPPAIVAILFPAIVFGVVSLFRYVRRDRP
jgi:hypothetical protein